ncbi:hypothetical protein [Histophilus somni]|uniref:hypothetical protein n=1 Tax=Histophilus somni TaxID=731 RepID=UPI00201F522C|nr:hypothetical protein [Histophilus somni]
MNKEKFIRLSEEVARRAGIAVHFVERENYWGGLALDGVVRGIKIFLSFEQKKDRITSSYSVGTYGRDKIRFGKKISFSENKAEEKIIQDLLKRLELEKTADFIQDLLDERARIEAKEELKRAEIEAFRKLLPFNKAFNDELFFYSKNKRIEISKYRDEISIRNNGNPDFIMKVCAAVVKLIEDEEKAMA